MKRHRSSPRSRWFVGALALLLISGCDVVRTPVEPSPGAVEELPPGITSVTSLVGRAAQLAWTQGLEDELDDVKRQIRSAPLPNQELMRRAEWLEGKLAEMASAAPAEESTSSSTPEAVDADAGIIRFGTQIRVPYGGPIAVTAFTETSRATHISHVMRVSTTSHGHTHSSLFRDDSGFFNQPALYTTVGVSGDCTTSTAVDAHTEHRAGSATFKHRFAMSTADASCGRPAEPCDTGEGGPDEQVVQSAGADDASASSGDCTGSGGGPGGETTPYTCYTVTTDYYWYYPDTNTYEYRYSEESTWCEETAA